jgi:hypothetical protein
MRGGILHYIVWWNVAIHAREERPATLWDGTPPPCGTLAGSPGS